jgi:hypothetical protein
MISEMREQALRTVQEDRKRVEEELTTAKAGAAAQLVADQEEMKDRVATIEALAEKRLIEAQEEVQRKIEEGVRHALDEADQRCGQMQEEANQRVAVAKRESHAAAERRIENIRREADEAVKAKAKEAADLIDEIRRAAELQHAETVRTSDARVAAVNREAQDKIAQAELCVATVERMAEQERVENNERARAAVEAAESAAAL